jgi:FkbM family methyltransferase
MEEKLPENFAYPPGYVHPESVEEAEKGLKKLTFPGGFSCYVQSLPGEAALIYNEVIVSQEYFQGGLSLAGARCVMDVGANIGIFTMEAKRKAPEAAIHAFEPIPDTFHVLEENVRLLEGADVHLYNVALGSEDHGEISLTFYPNMPGNSTSVRSLKDDNRPVMDQIFGKEAAEFFYQSETRTARVRTLSSVIREQEITSVDYLKIDVEGGEMSVLGGIEEGHWPLIRQIAVEAHTPLLREEVCEILSQRGFDVYTDRGLSSPSGASLVYGKRSLVN